MAEAGKINEAIFFGLLYPPFIFLLEALWRTSSLFGRPWLTAVRRDTADTLAAYTFRHSNQFYSDRFAGSLLSKIGNVVNAMERFIADFLWSHLEGLVSIIASGLVIFSIDAATGGVFILLVVALVILNIFLVPRKRDFSLASAASNTRL